MKAEKRRGFPGKQVIMLNIYFGDMPDMIYNTEVYFRNTYDSKWLISDMAKEMIRDVDKSIVVSEHCIDSPVLGQIPPERLSGGVKTLLLLLNDETKVFNASTCGDNCAKWILKIAQNRELTIRLGHIMDFGEERFSIRILNNGVIVNNMKDLLLNAHPYLQEAVE